MAIERELQRRQVSLTLTTPVSTSYITIIWLSLILPFCMMWFFDYFCTSYRWSVSCPVSMWYWMKTKNRWWNDSKHFDGVRPKALVIQYPVIRLLGLTVVEVNPSPWPAYYIWTPTLFLTVDLHFTVDWPTIPLPLTFIMTTQEGGR